MHIWLCIGTMSIRKNENNNNGTLFPACKINPSKVTVWVFPLNAHKVKTRSVKVYYYYCYYCYYARKIANASGSQCVKAAHKCVLTTHSPAVTHFLDFGSMNMSVLCHTPSKEKRQHAWIGSTQHGALIQPSIKRKLQWWSSKWNTYKICSL